MGLNVECVLCTYNGERYIYEQLESIRKQSYKVSKLIISDDGSTDKTVDIILGWIRKTNIITELYVNDEPLGPKKNFEKAFMLSKGEYVMFADQDDVWLPDKVAISLEKIRDLEKKYGKDMPCLVHSDLAVVDENLKMIHESFLENQGLEHIEDKERQIKCLLVQNYVTGCTIIVNNALRVKSLPFPKNIIMHDYWLALVASLSGRIAFINKPTLLYRQHATNTIGAVTYLSIFNIKKIFDAKKMLNRVDATIKQLRAVCEYKDGELLLYHDYIRKYLISVEEKNYLQVVLSGVRKQGILINIVFQFYLILYLLKGGKV